MTNPTEPTLTCSLNESNRAQSESGCSEVVARLATEAYKPSQIRSADYVRNCASHFDRAKAEEILHSWRERLLREAAERVPYLGMKFALEDSERRVQELEECLRDELMQAKACVSQMRTMPTNSQVGQDAVLKSADQRIKYMEDTLNSEWREHIRKGAKHD